MDRDFVLTISAATLGVAVPAPCTAPACGLTKIKARTEAKEDSGNPPASPRTLAGFGAFAMPRKRIGQRPTAPGEFPDAGCPYSYAEDVNEAPAIVAAEPVDAETAAPALPNVPVERLAPEDQEPVVSVEA
jgi:hypothetical protein